MRLEINNDGLSSLRRENNVFQTILTAFHDLYAYLRDEEWFKWRQYFYGSTSYFCRTYTVGLQILSCSVEQASSTS